MSNTNIPANPIQDAKKPELFVSWNSDQDIGAAFNEYGEGLTGSNNTVAHSFNYGSYKTRDIEPGISVRSGFSRDDYDIFRPDESLSFNSKSAIAACGKVYRRVGVVRNVIDLMSDFGCQGIEIIHPNPKVDKLCKHWFTKVRGKERSERFLNLLYRIGNVVIQRKTAKLNKQQRDRLYQGLGSVDLKLENMPKPEKWEIPWSYTFLNPLSLEVEEGPFAPMVGKYTFYVKIPSHLKNHPLAKSVNIPGGTTQGIEDVIQLDQTKIRYFFYKKDDWDVWAQPMIYPILDNVQLLEKMQLADLAALDGVISNVRIWKLGDLDKKILPTRAMISRLTEALANIGNGNTADLIWGPELSFEQHIPDVSKVLGSEKYVSVMSAIYGGLGIPPTLTGGSDKGGFTNNYISMKTLIERLEYGRQMLVDFWAEEFRLFQTSMGFKIPPRLHFSIMNLSDPTAEKALLIQLADRDIISIQTLLDRFGEDSEIEAARQRQEEKQRVKGNLPDRTGPWNDPQLDDKHRYREQEIKLQQDKKLNGDPMQGRPKNSKDSKKRKQKTAFIRTSADFAKMVLWASNAQSTIDELINPVYLGTINKQNMRQLTKAEDLVLSDIKFSIFSNLKPYAEITSELTLKYLQEQISALSGVYTSYQELMHNISSATSDELKQIRSIAFVKFHTQQTEIEE